jgi:Na+/H+ antiporter NhaD/arsenite permease-like protein
MVRAVDVRENPGPFNVFYKVIGNQEIINAPTNVSLAGICAPGPPRIVPAFFLKFTKKKVRKDNKFTYHPINEVAILFAGIFVTMVPLIVLLRLKGSEFGITEPWQFFWYTGSLSYVLDNAATYLTFFSLAQSVTAAIPSPGDTIAGVSNELLKAISCGAVFMGANTYIGNGPNFMVKSIAEELKVPVPHFFGYMFYSGIILIPVFILLTFIFFV